MCVSPNLRAVAMCEVVKDDSKGSGGGGGGGPAAAASGEAETDGGGKEDAVDKFDTKSQVSVYHIASRRRMRTMSIPMKGGT